MSCTAIQTDSPEEKPNINTSARSSPPPVYTPTQPTESPQSPQQQQQQQHVQQQQPVQYVMQPQPYMYPGVGRQITLPGELLPNDYLIPTCIVAIVCFFFNITSLVFSIPAFICSVMAIDRRDNRFYTTAKNLGIAAIILDLICITWVVVWGVVVMGLLQIG